MYNENIYIYIMVKSLIYSFYGMKIFPHPYEIVMNKNICNDGIRVCIDWLIKRICNKKRDPKILFSKQIALVKNRTCRMKICKNLIISL